VLANDYLACRLARMIGLSVPEPVIVVLVDERQFSCSKLLSSGLVRLLLRVLGFNSALPW
jgi:hypothetical protein